MSKFRLAAKRVPGSQRIAATVLGPRTRKRRMLQQLARQQREIKRLNSKQQAINRHLPNVLNTVASQHGAQRLLRRDIDVVHKDLLEKIAQVQSRFDDPESGVAGAITSLWERIEMVRREILFEVRYQLGSTSAAGSASPAEIKIVDRQRVDELTSAGPRLNIGCGHISLDGYINVDMRELPGVDVVAPVDALPFETGSVAEIFSSHVLEHFPIEQLRRELLPMWAGLLRPGGVLRAVVPDADAMIYHYAAGEMPYEQFREVFFGGQEYEGDFHFNMFTAESLTELLRDAGFNQVEVEARDRPNGLCYELQVAATMRADA